MFSDALVGIFFTAQWAIGLDGYRYGAQNLLGVKRPGSCSQTPSEANYMLPIKKNGP